MKLIKKLGYGRALFHCEFCNSEIEDLYSKYIRRKSCGCCTRGRNQKHGLSYTRIYTCWHSMKERCFNKSRPNYRLWGGKGVKICDEWLDFNNFMQWSLANGYNDLLQLDRIDNDGDYCPENCRWTTTRINSQNRSFIKMSVDKAKYARKLVKDGMTHAAVAKVFNVNQSTITRIVNKLTWI